MAVAPVAVGTVLNTLTAYIATAAQDVVAVYDTNFNQLFQEARPMSAQVKERAKVMEHPVETGSLITDHRVIDYIEIDMPMIVEAADYVNTYNEIKSTFLGTSTVYVQTNTGLYPSMMISEMPHKEDAEHFDTITLVLKFRQVIFVSATATAAPPLPDNTQNGGNKQGAAATPTQTGEATQQTQQSSAAYSLLFGKGGE